VSDPALLGAYDALQTDEERARGARFAFERHRHQHRVTRALVRCVLSRYAPVAPEAWRFEAGGHGRPQIGAPASARGLRFNLTHTDGLVACLVARDLDIGVDAEDATRIVEYVPLARRFFSAEEAAAVANAAEGAPRAERFFRTWTLKEAYLKARGLGLSLPLAAFAIRTSGERISIAFEPSIDDDPARWQFESLALGSHLLAVAVGGARAPMVLRTLETIPLRETP
jgi:4'-phosphopantetheinyl transferase